MIEALFEQILRLSLYGTIAGICVLLISLLIDRVRAARWISLVLWGVVALRLVVPFSVTSTVSVFRLWQLSDKIESSLDFQGTYTGDYKAAPEGSVQYEKAVAAGSPVKTENFGEQYAYYYERVNGTVEPAKTMSETVLPVCAYLWLAGVGVLWLWAAVSYVRLKAKLRFAMKLSDGVYEAEEISSPCVVGVFRPRIYLIPNLTGTQREHILLHEWTHIRYFDHIWKLLSFVVVSLHWFNPVLWLLYRYFQGELERACDERVLIKLGTEQKANYSESLLALAMERRWKLPTPIAFGEDDTKNRVKGILRYRKPLFVVSALVIVFAAAVCISVFTVPGRTQQSQPEVQQEAQQPPQSSAQDSGEADISRDLENTGEVYEEINDNGVIYQASQEGIYRQQGDSRELIYDGFAGTNPQMSVFEEKLYFLTDSSYEEGASDWQNDTIRWINLETQAMGDLPFTHKDTPISAFTIRQGIITIHYTDLKWDCQMLYVDKDTVLSDKNIAELSEAEKQRFGQTVTQKILQNPGTIVNISNRVPNRNISYLDMDGDGVSEEIVLEPSQNSEYSVPDEPLRYYRLQIGEVVLESYGYCMDNTLRAFSLDGKTMFLAIYEDGPSGDPLTHFYRYENDQIIEAGHFETDIQSCRLNEDGVISGTIFKEIANSDWIRVSWRQDADGMLEEIPQEIYDFTRGNWVELCVELPLHSGIGSEETFAVEPQQVKFLQTSADWSWLLIETEDGQQGWMHVVDHQVYELDKHVMDVFSGGYLAG